jgi:hypothetical protein
MLRGREPLNRGECGWKWLPMANNLLIFRLNCIYTYLAVLITALYYQYQGVIKSLLYLNNNNTFKLACYL